METHGEIYLEGQSYNEHVLRRIDEPRRITDILRRRKKKWIIQFIQAEGILSSILEGQYSKKRNQGRPRNGILDEITEGTYTNMKNQVMNEKLWRS